MKIQIASDLHLEYLRKFRGERWISPHPEADVLVLAGDIASGTDAIELFANWPVPLVHVAGNHEFYRADWAQVRADRRRPFAGHTVVVTHQGPHARSVHPRFAGNPVNAGFVSDLSGLLPLAGLWIHGHVHDSQCPDPSRPQRACRQAQPLL